MDGRQAEPFRVLAAKTRFRIIEFLKQKAALCVNEMSKALGISPSAVSQHLKVLEFAGLIRSERKGHWTPNEMDPTALEQCRKLLSRVCTWGCKGSGRIGKERQTRQKTSFLS